MTLYTVPGTGYATQLINAGDGPTMVINRDETNQLYVGDDNSVASKQGTGAIDIIDPLSYIVYDGISSKFGICAVANASIQIDTVQGATNWAPSPAQAAQQIQLLGLATASNQGTQITAANSTNNALNSGIALPVGAAKDTTVSTVATNTTGVAKDASVGAISSQAWSANSGLAKETGGNLATHTSLLNGTTAGALISGTGRSISQDMLHANVGVTTEIAALLASGSAAGTPGGIPLLNFDQNLYNITNQGVIGGTPANLGNVNVNQPGFEFLCDASSAAASQPNFTIQMQWFSGGNLVWVDNIVIIASTGGHSIQVRGPSKGAVLNVAILSPQNCTLTTFHMVQTSKVFSNKIEGKTLGFSGTTPGFANVPQLGGIENLVFTQGPTSVGIGATTVYLLGLFIGRVSVYLQTASGTSDAQCWLTDAQSGNVFFLQQTNSIGVAYATDVILHYAECTLSVKNGNAAAKNINVTIAGCDY